LKASYACRPSTRPGDLSRRMRDEGYRCILYTDLGNPTSNSVYRRIGYGAVAEGLRYRFE
jgi:predicted GNAT family acetyltransferase